MISLLPLHGQGAMPVHGLGNSSKDMATTARRTRHIGSVDNWQSGKTVVECNMHMLTSGVSCDVTFLVGHDGQSVSAHRFVLISRSCVFAAILSEINRVDTDMAIPDIEADDFHTFLIYLYTNEAEIDPKNATSLLYAARKYGVGGLEDECVDYLKEHLTPLNACMILEAAFQSNQMKLYSKALKMIHRNGEECLKTPSFLVLSHTCVDQIVRSDDLVAEETDVFEAVDKWAEAECKRQEFEITPRNKRQILGDVLMCVRFPLMESKYFVDTVGASGLLADDERLKIFVHNLFPEKDIKPFNKDERKGQRGSSKRSNKTNGSMSYREMSSREHRTLPKINHPLGSRTHRGFAGKSREEERNDFDDNSETEDRHEGSLKEHRRSKKEHHREARRKKGKRKVCNRTENRFRVQSFGRNCRGREWEPLKFRCREEIEFCGFLLFGPCDDDVATYDVEAHLTDEFNVEIAGSNIASSYKAKKEDVIFEVMFPSSIHLASRKWYTLNILIRGPPSMYGSDAKERMISHGVTFEFQQVESRANRNDQCQVPYLLFTKV
ncbi:BTB/POZ domain-containing protein 2-like [Haliotis cracherodii]|uniref:BTB/POZ domain-containing protein 2-like n=1 Tax=Haliotis cracherodii TaxID=6455 RepID=UPI0039E844FA